MSHICDRVVEAARYLQSVGMTQKQLSALHHFSLKSGTVSYAGVLRYFGRSKDLRLLNSDFAERLIHVANEHSRGRKDFDYLIQQALRRWPLDRQ